MAYVLEALIVDADIDTGDVPHVVPLAAGLRLVPLSDANRAWFDGRSSDPADTRLPDFARLDDRVASMGRELSQRGRTAYVHIESFGGLGFESSIGWERGSVASGPAFTANDDRERFTDAYEVVDGVESGAVNTALRFLGAHDPDGNEFELVGLGRERHTDDW